MYTYSFIWYDPSMIEVRLHFKEMYGKYSDNIELVQI